MSETYPVDQILEDAIKEENIQKLQSLPDTLDVDSLQLGKGYEHPLYFLLENYEAGLDEDFTAIVVHELAQRGMTGREKDGRFATSPAVDLLASRELPFDANYALLKKNVCDILEQGGSVKKFMNDIIDEVAHNFEGADYKEYNETGPLLPFSTDTDSLLNLVMHLIRDAEDKKSQGSAVLNKYLKTDIEPLVGLIEDRNIVLEDRALEVSKEKREIKKNFDQKSSAGKPKEADSEEDKPESDTFSKTEKETPQAVREDLEKNFIGQQDAKLMMRGAAARAVFDTIRHKNPEDMPKEAMHTRISGPTGVGKTTFAQYYNRTLTAIGRSNGNFVHLTREKVVATHIGQTEDAMKQFLEEAMGGVLFIDEVHNLTPEMGGGEKRDFGFRVVEALVAIMEEQRDNITIVVAGYDEDIERFLNSDKGLRGRFDNALVLKPYDREELGSIMDIFIEQHGLIMPDDVREHTLDEIMKYKEAVGEQFANGRVMRNFVEKLPTEMALRLMPDADPTAIENVSYEERNTVTMADAEAYLTRLRNSVPKVEKRRSIGFHAQH